MLAEHVVKGWGRKERERGEGGGDGGYILDCSGLNVKNSADINILPTNLQAVQCCAQTGFVICGRHSKWDPMLGDLHSAVSKETVARGHTRLCRLMLQNNRSMFNSAFPSVSPNAAVLPSR